MRCDLAKRHARDLGEGGRLLQRARVRVARHAAARGRRRAARDARGQGVLVRDEEAVRALGELPEEAAHHLPYARTLRSALARYNVFMRNGLMV